MQLLVVWLSSTGSTPHLGFVSCLSSKALTISQWKKSQTSNDCDPRHCLGQSVIWVQPPRILQDKFHQHLFKELLTTFYMHFTQNFSKFSSMEFHDLLQIFHFQLFQLVIFSKFLQTSFTNENNSMNYLGISFKNSSWYISCNSLRINANNYCKNTILFSR